MRNAPTLLDRSSAARAYRSPRPAVNRYVGAMLEGRTALVTGAGRGLGSAIAVRLAAQGARVLCHVRSEERARMAAATHGGEPVWGDLETQDGVLEVARQVAAAAPELHVLVHNAGVGSAGGIDDHAREQWERVIGVNAAAPLFLTQALLGPLRAAGRRARVVMVSSDSGRFSVPKDGRAFPYRMSKAALDMLTLNLAAALAPDGILVNAVHPGWVRTDMGGPNAPVTPERAAEAVLMLATLPDGGPSGRLWHDGRPVEW
jgi:NAD(P)-dependent dehydrogenase (short-subunit alcohol dehydrogenase family)